jgi:hypothetical protein
LRPVRPANRGYQAVTATILLPRDDEGGRAGNLVRRALPPPPPNNERRCVWVAGVRSSIAAHTTSTGTKSPSSRPACVEACAKDAPLSVWEPHQPCRNTARANAAIQAMRTIEPNAHAAATDGPGTRSRPRAWARGRCEPPCLQVLCVKCFDDPVCRDVRVEDEQVADQECAGIRFHRIDPHGSKVGKRAALSPLLAVTNVPVMLARLTARSLVASRRSAAASRLSRRGTSLGICAPTSACPLGN